MVKSYTDPSPLHPNDDDPAAPAPEPHLPLINDDDLTEPCPVVPSPPPKEVTDIIREPRCAAPPPDFNDDCSYGILPPDFSNSYNNYNISNPLNDNSYSTNDHIWGDDCSYGAALPPDIWGDDCLYGSALTPDFYNSYIISNPPPDQSSALPHQKKKRRHVFSRIGQKSSSNNNLDLKGHVVVKVRTTPADIIKLENNTRIIPEEEAVCRFCFHQLFSVNNNNNNNNVLKTKCLCPFTLTHEQCATEWSRKKGNIKCDVCDQDTNYIPVTLSNPPRTSEEKPDRGSSISTLNKWSCFRTG